MCKSIAGIGTEGKERAGNYLIEETEAHVLVRFFLFCEDVRYGHS